MGFHATYNLPEGIFFPAARCFHFSWNCLVDVEIQLIVAIFPDFLGTFSNGSPGAF